MAYTLIISDKKENKKMNKKIIVTKSITDLYPCEICEGNGEYDIVTGWSYKYDEHFETVLCECCEGVNNSECKKCSDKINTVLIEDGEYQYEDGYTTLKLDDSDFLNQAVEKGILSPADWNDGNYFLSEILEKFWR